MIFTWDSTDLCIIFDWWHVSGPFTLILSLVGVALLTAGYEAVREASRRYETSCSEKLDQIRREHFPSLIFSCPPFLLLDRPFSIS